MSRQAKNQAHHQTAAVTPATNGILQRKCACGQQTIAGGECTECSKARLPRHHPRTLDEIGQQLSATSQPLDNRTRSFMGDQFGVDFSGVRIHTNQAAQSAADVLRAEAFTIGTHVFFARDRYNPETSEGKFLLAHELTHVVQQGNTPVSLQNSDSPSGAMSGLETEADTIAQHVVDASNTSYLPTHNIKPARSRVTLASAPLGFLLRRRPGQGFLDCVNECTSSAGFTATLGAMIIALCGVVAVLAAAAATPETGGTATVPAGLLVAAACAGLALGIPTGIMATCLWDCRS